MNATVFTILFWSLAQATVSALLSILLALPLAHFISRFSFKGKRMAYALMMMLCVMSTKLTAIAVDLCYGLHGSMGIIVGHVLLNAPFVCCLLSLTYQKLDYTVELVAQDLGATNWQRYKTVVFPLLKSTIVSSVVVVFLYCFSSYSIPKMLGTAWYHTTPEIMLCTLYGSGNMTEAFLYGAVRFLVVAAVCVASLTRSDTLSTHLIQGQPLPRYQPKRHGKGWLIFVLSVGAFLLAPFAKLFAQVFDQKVFNFLKNVFTVDTQLGMSVYQVVYNSVWLAALSSCMALCIGFALSKAARSVRSKRVAKFIGLSSGITFILGSVGSGILFSVLALWLPLKWSLLVLCHMFLHFPITYRLIQAQLDSYQPEWTATAQSCGASKSHVFRTIELPFIKKSLLKSFCLVFGFSLSEVGASAVLGDAVGMTMPMAKGVYRAVGHQEGVIGLSVILLLLVFCVTYVIQIFDTA